MVSTVKMGLKAYISGCTSIKSYLSRLLLSYRSIPHAGKTQSPSALMGRQIRAPITMSFETGEKVWYFGKDKHKAEPAEFIVQAGNNTAIVLREKGGTIVHSDQIQRRKKREEDEGIDNESELDRIATDQGQTKEKKSKYFDELEDNRISVEDQTTEETSGIQSPPPKTTSSNHPVADTQVHRRSTRANIGVKPMRYGVGEML